MFKSGWVRLTIVAWVTWVLWTLGEHGWREYQVCEGVLNVPGYALCEAWSFGLPPLLALGLWWAGRAFGKDKVAKALSSPKAPTVATLLLAVLLTALAARLHRQVEDVDRAVGQIDDVARKVGYVGASVEEVKTTVEEVKASVEDAKMSIENLR